MVIVRVIAAALLVFLGFKAKQRYQISHHEKNRDVCAN